MSRTQAERHIAAVLQFWESAGPERWFGHNDLFDATFGRHFLDAHHAAARREYEDWLDSAEGALALLILVDQLPRNCFRGSAHAYATDGLALHYAKCAVAAGFDYQVRPELRLFFYLPFAHSEDPAEQARSVALHQRLGEPEANKWAVLHQDIIDRFGRFPHRNSALGRESTPEERQYLDEGGFAG